MSNCCNALRQMADLVSFMNPDGTIVQYTGYVTPDGDVIYVDGDKNIVQVLDDALQVPTDKVYWNYNCACKNNATTAPDDTCCTNTNTLLAEISAKLDPVQDPVPDDTCCTNTNTLLAEISAKLDPVQDPVPESGLYQEFNIFKTASNIRDFNYLSVTFENAGTINGNAVPKNYTFTLPYHAAGYANTISLRGTKYSMWNIGGIFI